MLPCSSSVQGDGCREFRALGLALLVLLATAGSGSWLYQTAAGAEVMVWESVTPRRLHAPSGFRVGEVVALRSGCPLGADVVIPRAELRAEEGWYVSYALARHLEVAVGGKLLRIFSAARTVPEVLAESGIEMGPHDYALPRALLLSREPRLEVVRVRYEVVVEDVRVPNRVVRVPDSRLYVGLTKVLQRGRRGIERIIWRVRYENEREVSREVVGRQQLIDPVDEVIAYGTNRFLYRNGRVYRIQRALEVIATAYYPGPECTAPYTDGLTAIGLRAGKGIVAVDPGVIPLGSRLYVDGYGLGVAGDVGADIKGLRIDVCFDSLIEAIQWGRKRVLVFILE